MSRRDELMANLIQSLRLLAADYDDQVRFFPSFVDIPDELALTFHDSVVFIDGNPNDNPLDEAAYAEVKALDAVFDVLTDMCQQGDSEIFSLAGVRDRLEWQEVRLRARKLLESLGYDRTVQQVQNVEYVRSRRRRG